MSWTRQSVLLCRGGDSMHGNVDRMALEIVAAFRAEGWRATAVNMNEGDYAANEQAVVARLRAGEFDLMLSLQDMGHYDRPDAAAIFAQGGVRRLYWSLDHPYSSARAVMELPAGSIVTFPTAANLACCRRFLRQDVALRCVAHAAAPVEGSPWEARTIPILFVGNRGKKTPEAMRHEWPNLHDGLAVRVLNDMAEAFDPFRTESLEALAEDVLARHRVVPDRPTFFNLLHLFDSYAWAQARAAYVAALKGLPVAFAGQGWEDLAEAPARVIGPLPSVEARALMGRARVVLNILPAYYRSHERVFEGMAAGAAVASSGRAYLANALGAEYDPADANAIAYLGPPGEAADRLAALLADDARLQTMAAAGQAGQRAQHTWRNRVAGLLASLEGATS